MIVAWKDAAHRRRRSEKRNRVAIDSRRRAFGISRKMASFRRL